MYYNTSDIIFQQLPIWEKIKKTEINGMKTGFIIDTITSVNIQEFVKLRGNVIDMKVMYAGIIWKGSFKASAFRNVIEFFFNSRLK